MSDAIRQPRLPVFVPAYDTESAGACLQRLRERLDGKTVPPLAAP